MFNYSMQLIYYKEFVLIMIINYYVGGIIFILLINFFIIGFCKNGVLRNINKYISITYDVFSYFIITLNPLQRISGTAKQQKYNLFYGTYFSNC